ncbi:hypothetical protein AMAG_00251 [Allomyces macrogynus ATCC 38327]|uniref:Uncharacterized protein n=1 Tax=Allomyces macrogynus (strain ATCC 38327) TaxID=578462 RepID=A0A0L0RVT2_ALLM3|nr:hypothetical protein AMAG_00251 [Allomyces macrogynus ATCC 38327]|eukprot:KNE54259.1 hypothetical protein AMAG_00251 [Allomyces macrogynus ATCC 38327]
MDTLQHDQQQQPAANPPPGFPGHVPPVPPLAHATQLARFRARRWIACGQVKIAVNALAHDVKLLRDRYVRDATDLSYACFLKTWRATHFSLVHLAAPPPRAGRDDFLHAIAALILDEPTPSGDSVEYLDIPGRPRLALPARGHALATCFIVYALFTLWKTTPPWAHFSPYPIAVARLATVLHAARVLHDMAAHLKVLVRWAGDMPVPWKSTAQFNLPGCDAAYLLHQLTKHHCLAPSAWEGGSGLSWHTTVPTHPLENRWCVGVAGDGWTRLLQPVVADPAALRAAAAAAPIDATKYGRALVSAAWSLRGAHVVDQGLLARAKDRGDQYAAIRDAVPELPQRALGTDAVIQLLAEFEQQRTAALSRKLNVRRKPRQSQRSETGEGRGGGAQQGQDADVSTEDREASIRARGPGIMLEPAVPGESVLADLAADDVLSFENLLAHFNPEGAGWPEFPVLDSADDAPQFALDPLPTSSWSRGATPMPQSGSLSPMLPFARASSQPEAVADLFAMLDELVADGLGSKAALSEAPETVWANAYLMDENELG